MDFFGCAPPEVETPPGDSGSGARTSCGDCATASFFELLQPILLPSHESTPSFSTRTVTLRDVWACVQTWKELCDHDESTGETCEPSEPRASADCIPTRATTSAELCASLPPGGYRGTHRERASVMPECGSGERDLRLGGASGASDRVRRRRLLVVCSGSLGVGRAQRSAAEAHLGEKKHRRAACTRVPLLVFWGEV